MSLDDAKDNYISPYKILIEKRIREKFSHIEYLEILDESYMHSGGPFASSHFKVILVSNDFIGENMVKRHRKIFSLFSKELEEQIHSLSLKLNTHEEWQKNNNVEKSPGCMGKNTEWNH